MKFLCLIHLDESMLAAMPEHEMSALNARHVAFNDSLRASGHFIEAEALGPGRSAATIRLRHGTPGITDGPFAETKELVAGFYLIEARDMAEATEIASRIPSAPLGTIEVRPTRHLLVDGREV
ncbi:MAG: YciI family protein, partial [Candidatus Eremiobacteraeota bacterium]|nr:YciI family protein [Candidatus Eremiobacteraeota bacterium]